MKEGKKLVVFIFLVSLVSSAATPRKPAVRYREDTTGLFTQHLQVQILTTQVAIYAGEKEKKYSENKSAYYVYFPDNKEKEPPYYSSVFLVGPVGTKPIKLYLRDHGRKEPVCLGLTKDGVSAGYG
ncbi:MAG: hypothetical protein NC911_04370 [Candidatus Omnitrophica bacterium]|nr:hypothetical protein [Candidatus Omnitrophota bacterium]